MAETNIHILVIILKSHTIELLENLLQAFEEDIHFEGSLGKHGSHA